MARRPNVVVLVLDSVRYDHTTVGDHHRNTTPNIERIASRSDGTSFDTAIAHSKQTSQSSASILTGKYPAEHRFGYDTSTLDSSIPTVAEAFGDAGYNTACVSNNAFVGRETGLARGFEEYTLLPESPLAILRTVGLWPTAKFLVNVRRHSAGFQRDIHRHSGAYLTTSLVHQQLDALEGRSDPFFLYAHFNQPHRAYYPPLTWFDTYSDASEMSTHDAGEFSMDVHHNLTERVAEGCPFTDDEWAALKALYDTEIRYTDTFVGELFDRIRDRFGDTVFVVTADHGEHFGERGALAHRYVLDDALLRVPLVTSGLEVADPDAPVQHSDVMRTLLAEGDAHGEFADGVDLRDESRDVAVSQDGDVSLESILEYNPEFDGEQFFPGADRSIPERTALRTRSHRYVRAPDGREVLFEIPDEAEGGDISDEEPEMTAELSGALDDWFADHPSARPGRSGDGDSELTSGTKERLKRMGYLEEDL